MDQSLHQAALQLASNHDQLTATAEDAWDTLSADDKIAIANRLQVSPPPKEERIQKIMRCLTNWAMIEMQVRQDRRTGATRST